MTKTRTNRRRKNRIRKRSRRMRKVGGGVDYDNLAEKITHNQYVSLSTDKKAYYTQLQYYISNELKLKRNEFIKLSEDDKKKYKGPYHMKIEQNIGDEHAKQISEELESNRLTTTNKAIRIIKTNDYNTKLSDSEYTLLDKELQLKFKGIHSNIIDGVDSYILRNSFIESIEEQVKSINTQISQIENKYENIDFDRLNNFEEKMDNITDINDKNMYLELINKRNELDKIIKPP